MVRIPCSVFTGLTVYVTYARVVGEALYRFLLSQAQRRPKLVAHLHGSHTERRYRTVTHKDAHGRVHTREESHDEVVEDFCFSVDASPGPQSSVVHWSVPDEEPAYRGKMYKQVDGAFSAHGPVRLADDDVEAGSGSGSGRRRKAGRKEVKSANAWKTSRWERGLPPWVGPASVEPGAGATQTGLLRTPEANVLKSSKTLREWADEYCASDKWLKEFTYEKVSNAHV